MPETIPDNGGAPEAKAIPKHNGNATRNTTKPEGRFSLIPPDKLLFFFMTEKFFFEKYRTIDK